MAAPPSARNARPRRSPLDWLGFLAAVAAVVVIWLPFAYGVSPGEAIGALELRYLAAPFLLAFPIAAGHAWRLSRPGVPPGAAWIGRVLSGAAVASTALFYARSFRRGDWPDPADPRDWIALALPLAFLAAWAVLVVRWSPDGRRPREASQPSDHDHAIVLMELAWLANAVPSLFAFYGELDAGGYVTLAVAALFAAHAVAVVRGAGAGMQKRTVRDADIE